MHAPGSWRRVGPSTLGARPHTANGCQVRDSLRLVDTRCRQAHRRRSGVMVCPERRVGLGCGRGAGGRHPDGRSPGPGTGGRDCDVMASSDLRTMHLARAGRLVLLVVAVLCAACSAQSGSPTSTSSHVAASGPIGCLDPGTRPPSPSGDGFPTRPGPPTTSPRTPGCSNHLRRGPPCLAPASAGSSEKASMSPPSKSSPPRCVSWTVTCRCVTVPGTSPSSVCSSSAGRSTTAASRSPVTT